MAHKREHYGNQHPAAVREGNWDLLETICHQIYPIRWNWFLW